MDQQCARCGGTVRRTEDGTVEVEQGPMSRAYVTQDEHGGWYGDAGHAMQDSDPQRTKEQAQEWVIERLNSIAERPCAIYTDYQAWLREAYKAKKALQQAQSERDELRQQCAPWLDYVEARAKGQIKLACEDERWCTLTKQLTDMETRAVAAEMAGDALESQLQEAQAEMGAIRFAAHMPAEYQFGLPSWINQQLYGRLIALLDKDGLPIRRTEDIEALWALRKQLQEAQARLVNVMAYLELVVVAIGRANERDRVRAAAALKAAEQPVESLEQLPSLGWQKAFQGEGEP